MQDKSNKDTAILEGLSRRRMSINRNFKVFWWEAFHRETISRFKFRVLRGHMLAACAAWLSKRILSTEESRGNACRVELTVV